MPYKKFKRDRLKSTTSPFISKIKGEIQDLIEQNQYDFYEIEAVEVVDVLLDEERLPKKNGIKDDRYYGAIKGRWIENKKQTILPLGEMWILPLDSNIKRYPVIGENVVCSNHLGRTYYTTTVGIFNSPNNNILPGLSSTGEPRTEKIHQIYEGGGDSIQRRLNVKANPGDLVLQGRHGQSINLGSHQQTVSSIKMVAGHNPKNDYDINKDGASIYIQDGGSVNVKNPNEKYKTYPVVGSKVVINADEIVLNARKNLKLVAGSVTEVLGKHVELKHNKGGSIFTGETKELLDNTRDRVKNEIIREIEECIEQILLITDKTQEDFERVSKLIEKLTNIKEIGEDAVDRILGAEISINNENFAKLTQRFDKIVAELPTIPPNDPVRLARVATELAQVLREFSNVKELFRPNLKLGKPSE